MKVITCKELSTLINSGEPYQLIDVRESYEHEADNIGGILASLHEIMQHSSIIKVDRPVILYCRVGVRSALAIQRLELKGSFDNLLNLDGGMVAWRKEFQ